MYADPSKIRSHTIKIRLNDEEANFLDAFVAYTGDERAPVARELLLKQLMLALFGEDHSQASRTTKEGPELARIAA
jgi:hypothetical protein